MSNYDCTNDVLEHRSRVAYLLGWLTGETIAYRAEKHDESKLHSPEKEIFDEFVPKLRTLEFGSDEYKASLAAMGRGLQHHYQVNSHHPEYHKNGIDGMTIWDLVEMLADWMAATSVKNASVNLDYLQERFSISPQLRNIIANTLRCADMDAINCIVPIEYQPIRNFLSPSEGNHEQ